MTRTVFILCTQLKTEKVPMPQEALYDDAISEKWRDSFLPHYTVITSRIELEKVILRIKKYGMFNYTFTETDVNSYALPNKVQ